MEQPVLGGAVALGGEGCAAVGPGYGPLDEVTSSAAAIAASTGSSSGLHEAVEQCAAQGVELGVRQRVEAQRRAGATVDLGLRRGRQHGHGREANHPAGDRRLCGRDRGITVLDVIRLVSRRHVDNMHVTSAACRPGR